MTDKPTEIGRYFIEEKIGQGSMGEVYRATDYRLYRRVAVKTVRLDNLGSEQERQRARKLFLREARITGNLNHGHIATIYDMGIHKGLPFLVMEFIEGRNLKDIINEQSPYSIKEKLNVISIIGRAIHYAHQRGVLHRDIKPANIMILANGAPKITDFGIAGIMDISSGKGGKKLAGHTMSILGTPNYMSPEHIKGKECTTRSDIFSLGILAYEWICGRRPFVGSTIRELMNTILAKPPQPFTGGPWETDKELEHIIFRALAKEPGMRFQNAEEFSDNIEIYLDRVEQSEDQTLSATFSYDKLAVIERLRRKYIFFSDFSEDELLTIFKLAQKKQYVRGEYIIREGTMGTKMYVIISGSVSVQNDQNGREIELEQLPAGSCVGEMSLVDRRERSASVVALEPTLAIAINETVLRLSNPKICLKLYRNLATILSERLRTVSEKLRCQ